MGSILDGPAFPFERVELRRGGMVARWSNCPGLSGRAYAAIHLLVPNSGDEELDAMILKRLRVLLASESNSASLEDAREWLGLPADTPVENSRWIPKLDSGGEQIPKSVREHVNEMPSGERARMIAELALKNADALIQASGIASKGETP